MVNGNGKLDVQFDAVPVIRLHEVWPFVRRGLEDIVKKNKPDWWPEDVYARLSNSQATLYLVHHNGRPVSFFVVYLSPLQYSLGQELIYWCGWGIPPCEWLPEDHPHELRVAMGDFFKELARQSGAKRVASLSARKGYDRLATELGLHRTFTRYECDL